MNKCFPSERRHWSQRYQREEQILQRDSKRVVEITACYVSITLFRRLIESEWRKKV